MKLEDLTPEQKKELHLQIIEEGRLLELSKIETKKTLQSLTEGLVDDNINDFICSQTEVETHIEKLFRDAEVIIDARAEVYGVEKKDQDSHTFTKNDGSSSIKMGWNVKPTFNGTESLGIQKIKQYMGSLAGETANEKLLMDFLNIALKTDVQGNYNPKKVRELNTMRDKADSKLFNDGMDIIDQALIDVRTSMYVRGYKLVKGDDKLTRRVEFSFSIKPKTVEK